MEFNQTFKNYVLNINGERSHDEWMQIYPNDWDIVLRSLFKQSEPIIESETRVNFKFNKKKYLQNKLLAVTIFKSIQQQEKILKK